MWIDSPLVSRDHCELTVSAEGCTVIMNVVTYRPGCFATHDLTHHVPHPQLGMNDVHVKPRGKKAGLKVAGKGHGTYEVPLPAAPTLRHSHSAASLQSAISWSSWAINKWCALFSNSTLGALICAVCIEAKEPGKPKKNMRYTFRLDDLDAVAMAAPPAPQAQISLT